MPLIALPLIFIVLAILWTIIRAYIAGGDPCGSCGAKSRHLKVCSYRAGIPVSPTPLCRFCRHLYQAS